MRRDRKCNFRGENLRPASFSIPLKFLSHLKKRTIYVVRLQNVDRPQELDLVSKHHLRSLGSEQRDTFFFFGAFP